MKLTPEKAREAAKRRNERIVTATSLILSVVASPTNKQKGKDIGEIIEKAINASVLEAWAGMQPCITVCNRCNRPKASKITHNAAGTLALAGKRCAAFLDYGPGGGKGDTCGGTYIPLYTRPEVEIDDE